MASYSERAQRRNQQREWAKKAVAGTGRYLFENNSSGDLMLPKSSLCGRKTVAKNGRFEGDSYFFAMVKTGELKYIQEIEHMQNEVLLTEQPPVYTADGQVEYVLTADQQAFNEAKDKLKQPAKKLLTEPVGSKLKTKTVDE
jgi:hypothetical protein